MSATTRAGRPPRALSVANRALTRALTRGRGPAFLRLLTVAGRATGEPRTTPIVPVIEGGRIWLVSAYGDSAWVRNVRASGRVEVGRGAERDAYEARELPAAEAVPVLRTYLAMPSSVFVRRRFQVRARSADADIEAEAPRHPVFALTPVPRP